MSLEMALMLIGIPMISIITIGTLCVYCPRGRDKKQIYQFRWRSMADYETRHEIRIPGARERRKTADLHRR